MGRLRFVPDEGEQCVESFLRRQTSLRQSGSAATTAAEVLKRGLQQLARVDA
jgi:hypothetical protein